MSDRPDSSVTRFTRLHAWVLLVASLLLALNLALRSQIHDNRLRIERLEARVAAAEELRDAEFRAVHALALDPVIGRCLALDRTLEAPFAPPPAPVSTDRI